MKLRNVEMILGLTGHLTSSCYPIADRLIFRDSAASLASSFVQSPTSKGLLQYFRWKQPITIRFSNSISHLAYIRVPWSEMPLRPIGLVHTMSLTRDGGAFICNMKTNVPNLVSKDLFALAPNASL